MKKMEGKVVLITGGARGIGYGIAKAFAEEGANIVITGRTASTLIEARENLEASPRRTASHPAAAKYICRRP